MQLADDTKMASKVIETVRKNFMLSNDLKEKIVTITEPGRQSSPTNKCHANRQRSISIDAIHIGKALQAKGIINLIVIPAF